VSSKLKISHPAPVHGTKNGTGEIENGKMNCKILALKRLADILE
jgi:hypothetical protein